MFFATSKRGGKDSKGDYIYQLGEDGLPVLDAHGHMMVEHDLEDITNAFVEFSRSEGFHFWEEDY